jgi:calcineurin-like phosphoesterase family protein
MGLTYPTQYDVGVDFNDYKPIPFSELEEIIDTQIKNKTNQLFWINGEYMRE